MLPRIASVRAGEAAGGRCAIRGVCRSRELDDMPNHLLEGEARRIYGDGPRSCLQDSPVARGIERVSPRQVIEHRLRIRARFRCPSAGPLLGAGNQKDLHLRVWGDDGSDVSTLHHPISLRDQSPLPLDQRGPHRRDLGDLRRRLGYLGSTDPLGQVTALDHHAS